MEVIILSFFSYIGIILSHLIVQIILFAWFLCHYCLLIILFKME